MLKLEKGGEKRKTGIGHANKRADSTTGSRATVLTYTETTANYLKDRAYVNVACFGWRHLR